VLVSTALDQVGVTMGQSIGGHLVVAATLKLVHALSETRGGLDVGTMAAFGPVRLGLTVRDVTSGTFGSEDGAFELAPHAPAGVARHAPFVDGLTVDGRSTGITRKPRSTGATSAT
jgi:hypothetical protein